MNSIVENLNLLFRKWFSYIIISSKIDLLNTCLSQPTTKMVLINKEKQTMILSHRKYDYNNIMCSWTIALNNVHHKLLYLSLPYTNLDQPYICKSCPFNSKFGYVPLIVVSTVVLCHRMRKNLNFCQGSLRREIWNLNTIRRQCRL